MSTRLIQDWSDRQASSLAQWVELRDRGTGKRSTRKSDRTPLPSTFREPRIRFFAQVIALLQTYDPPPKDRVARGFSLRDPSMFRSDRVDKIKWNLGALSSVCNLDCEFCYRYGSPTEGPDAVVISQGRSLLSENEAEARLDMIESGEGLFAASADLGEDFVNPNLLAIYSKVRKRAPSEVIDTTTHGGFLTEEVVEELARLRPVDLAISLNSSNPETRRRLMKDRDPMVAISSLERMRRHKIWYSVSIVAWPDVPTHDLCDTIRFADRHRARVIRVQLPGKSRFHPSRLDYDRKEVWYRIVTLLRKMRREVATPIYWQPYLYGSDPVEAEITGAIVGSPAALAGVRDGDILQSVNGAPVRSREEGRAMIYQAAESVLPTDIVLKRNSKEISVNLDPGAKGQGYPFAAPGYNSSKLSFGVFMNQGVHVPSIVDVLVSGMQRGRRRLLLITSELMKDSVTRILAATAAKLPQAPAYDLIVPAPTFFGGDIILGDLLVFADIDAAIRSHEASNGTYDEIVLPETLTEAGTDLNGVRFDSFNKKLGYRCRMARHPRILD